MKTRKVQAPSTEARLRDLLTADLTAGRKIKWLAVSDQDRAGLVEDIRAAGGPRLVTMKKQGIDHAMPTLDGVPLRWGAALTHTGPQAD
jgi:hypothetical protein